MVKLKETRHFMHKVRGNYSSCTGRSSENICSNSGGVLCSDIVGMFGTLSLGVFVPEMEQSLLNLQLKYHVLPLGGLMIMILLPQLLPPQVAA